MTTNDDDEDRIEIVSAPAIRRLTPLRGDEARLAHLLANYLRTHDGGCADMDRSQYVETDRRSYVIARRSDGHPFGMFHLHTDADGTEWLSSTDDGDEEEMVLRAVDNCSPDRVLG